MYYASVNKDETVTFNKNGVEHTVSWETIEKCIKKERAALIKKYDQSYYAVKGRFNTSAECTKDIFRRAKIYFATKNQMHLEIFANTYDF